MQLYLVCDFYNRLRIVEYSGFSSQKWKFFTKLENSKISPPENHSPAYRAFLRWLWKNGFENPLEQVWTTAFLEEKQGSPVESQTDSAPRQLTAAAAAGIDLKNATDDEVIQIAGQMLREAAEAVADPTPAESVSGITPPPVQKKKPSPPSGAAPGHNIAQHQPEVWVPVMIPLPDGTTVQGMAPVDMTRAMMLTPVPGTE